MKKGRTYKEEETIPRERYFNDGYFQRKQMDSLVSQLICVHEKKVKKILEVGPGNGFVSNFLKNAGYEVTTFDINPSLKPDVTGNLAEIETYFEASSFDLILCAEVLEHLPFELFKKIISQFQKISSNWVIITLPIRRRTLVDYNWSLKIPKLKEISGNLYLHLPINNVKWSEHHWEINYSDYCTIPSLLKVFKKDFVVDNHYIDKRNKMHYFFELKA